MEKTLDKIRFVDRTRVPEIKAHLDDLTKPQGSLGALEKMALRYVLASGELNPKVGAKRVCVFAGDHGLVEEGLTFSGQEVTAQVVRNMLSGGAGINVFSRHVGVDVEIVDVGVATDLSDADGLIDRKLQWGTQNIRKKPAMSRETCLQAIQVGIERAEKAASDGIRLLATGEMGIGNTTPSSALMAALLPCAVSEVTGPGAGFHEPGLLAEKVKLIEDALALHADQLSDSIAALAAVGGLEIAAMCGLCLGGAAHRVPVVVDGFIASAAALVACRIAPAVADYLFLSHESAEPGHAVFAREMGLDPILHLGLRLGEGTGAVLAMTLIDASIRMYSEMATFSSARIANPPLNQRCFPVL